ncbi:uncharacterized protein LOC115356549 [Myripristis murdjan]|uniref:uncharacterized protein LOC115356549 n=1 Tax=Myripristis murdjan TaxID=586833 RepID=UPI0011764091|nr:uncharacterized protein LOC115356549 [Myripristis murdjan]
MAEESEEAREAREARRRLPRIRMPRKIWKTSRPQPQTHLEELSGCEEALPELLEEQSRRLIGREEQLFGQEAPSEEEQDALQKELEDLLLQVWTAVHNSFSESPADLEELRSAVTSIQQQEVQDRRWQGAEEGRVPVWRPQKCLSTHTQLLRNMVVSRLDHATVESGGAESAGADGLSSSLKREVCQTGKRLKEDLLSVARRVKACYPPELDIVNVYAGLYQQSFSARLMELARPGLSPDDCCYLLFWVNTCYPQ